MKITKRDLGVLMILAGFLIAFLVYQTSFKGTMEEVEALQNEQVSLRSQISELQPIKDNAQFYQDEMTRYEKEINETMEEFPANIIYEDGIMYSVNMTENLGVQIPSITVTPATTLNSVTGNSKTYTLLRATETMSYTVEDYDTLKDLITYVYTNEQDGKVNKNTITSISMAFDEGTGEITGSLNMDMFAMTDDDREYTPVELPLDSLGVENIFGEVVDTE